MDTTLTQTMKEGRDMLDWNMIKTKDPSVMVRVFNVGYVIAILMYLASSIGSLCTGVIALRTLGAAELAAIGLVYSYTKFMECVSHMFSGGSQVVIGRKIGRNRVDEVSKVFYTALTVTEALSVVIALLMISFAGPVAHLFGAEEASGTLSATRMYLMSLAIGAPAHLLSLYMIPLFQLDEKNKLINTAAIVLTTVNVTLNILFVHMSLGNRFVDIDQLLCGTVSLVDAFFDEKKGMLLRGNFGFSGGTYGELYRKDSPPRREISHPSYLTRW